METKQSGPILYKSTEPSDKGSLWVHGQGISHHRPSPAGGSHTGLQWEVGVRATLSLEQEGGSHRKGLTVVWAV